VLARNDEPRGEVEQQAGAAGQRERGKGDPVDQWVDVEVAAEPCGDAAEPAALVDAHEPPRRRIVERGVGVDRFGHGEPPWMMRTASIPPGRGGIGHHPDPTLIFGKKFP
jgi:hypothetical protein